MGAPQVVANELSRHPVIGVVAVEHCQPTCETAQGVVQHCTRTVLHIPIAQDHRSGHASPLIFLVWLHSLTAEAVSILASPRRRLAQVVDTDDLGSSIRARLLRGSQEARTLTKTRLAARRSDE